MTQPLGSKAIVVNTQQTFLCPMTGLKGLLIDNASPFSVDVNLEGSSIHRTLNPDSQDFFPVQSGFNGSVVFYASALVTNPQSYPNYVLSIDAVGLNEQINISQYPTSHPRPAVTATASGQPIFSATVGFGSTVSTVQSLNIFNPQNSGVSYRFHSARCFTNDATIPTVNLVSITGADLSLPSGVSAVSHNCAAIPPVSTAHCTSEDSAGGHGGTTIEVLDIQQNTTVDFLAFPDEVILQPGNNLRVAIVSAGTGKIVRMTMKWTEVPFIALSGLNTGGITTGNILIASTVVNNGSAPGTGVISISLNASGTPITFFVDNNGNVTILGTTKLGNILSFGLGSLHFGQLALGDTFDSDINGNIYFKSAAVSNQSINFQPINGITTAFFGTNGLTFNSGAINSQTAGTVVNGGTSGTATAYEFMIGNVKAVLVNLNNFRTAGVAQNLVLPTAFTFGAEVWTGGIGNSVAVGGVLFLLAGVSQIVRVLTTLAVLGGSVTNATGNVLYENSYGTLITGFDTLQFPSGGTAGKTGSFIIMGQ